MADLVPDGTITITAPTFPQVVTPPATSGTVHVVPIAGPAGPAGASGGVTVEHHQDTPAAQWSIPATGFTRRPVVAIYVGNELVDTDVTATTDLVVITFPFPTAGTAVLT